MNVEFLILFLRQSIGASIIGWSRALEGVIDAKIPKRIDFEDRVYWKRNLRLLHTICPSFSLSSSIEITVLNCFFLFLRSTRGGRR